MHFLTNEQEAGAAADQATYARGDKAADDHMEALQIQRYGPPRGDLVDFYKPHVDSIRQTGAATMIYYLSDVEEGGETMFPFVWRNRAGGSTTSTTCDRPSTTRCRCSLGVRQPERRRAQGAAEERGRRAVLHAADVRAA